MLALMNRLMNLYIIETKKYFLTTMLAYFLLLNSSSILVYKEATVYIQCYMITDTG